ncbi:helix-turn-helix transcriptional regulator [Levilactobacillus spicheri]|uniref:HTH cro/C1-type domain-containing protein n=2 Tax=Levilactobacillus spicheri TaxID=216463 RepID=A0ABQ0WY13_9LACO|nr:helix-turn-helix transcriptional regulator [Levilactobacillus spicheri]KRL47506.1 hypothetical protein FD37_GL002374 [Levilactobacillus spicheri DSM 15429]GEO67851.1 hypothetical protein LSP04_22700 [Levilactobacillus spicheri]
MELGQRIRSARKQQNMTQAHLAQLVGVDPWVVDRWEGGICAPAPAQLDRVNRILRLHLEARYRVPTVRGKRRSWWPWSAREDS